METRVRGRVWVFDDDVDTDVMAPWNTIGLPWEERRQSVLHIRPEFAANVQPGDVIVAGANWGCGSSREHAPENLKLLGVSGVVAESFGRIYFRNCIAIAFPNLACPGIRATCEDGDEVEFDLANGRGAKRLAGRDAAGPALHAGHARDHRTGRSDGRLAPALRAGGSVLTRKRVVVIEGEDAAPEAVRPSVELIDRLGVDIEWLHPPVGRKGVDSSGSPFPAEARAAIDASDATLFGATSGSRAPALFYLRWGKQTYANVRPARHLPGFRSPLAAPEGMDLVIVRENLEDMYMGVEGDIADARAARPRKPHRSPAGRRTRPGALRAEDHHRARERARRALRLRAGAAARDGGPARPRDLRHQAQHAPPERRSLPRAASSGWPPTIPRSSSIV